MKRKWMSGLLTVVMLMSMVSGAWAADAYEEDFPSCQASGHSVQTDMMAIFINPHAHRQIDNPGIGRDFHEVSGQRVHFNRCQTCAIFQRPTDFPSAVEEVESELMPHVFGADRTCLVCGYAKPDNSQCACKVDPDKALFEYPSTLTVETYEAASPSRHVYVKEFYRSPKVCADCGEIYGEPENGGERYEQAHKYSPNNPRMCFQCGYETTCQHSEKIIVTQFMGGQYLSKNDRQHTVCGYPMRKDVCLDCDGEFEWVYSITRDLGVEEHLYEIPSTTCMNCGYVMGRDPETDPGEDTDVDVNEGELEFGALTEEMRNEYGISSVEGLRDVLLDFAYTRTGIDFGAPQGVGYELRDVTVWITENGRRREAVQADYPLTVTLSYPALPAGVDPTTLNYTVVHMAKNGSVDYPQITAKLPEGLQVIMESASPVLIGWEENAPAAPTIPIVPTAPAAPKTGDDTPLSLLAALALGSAILMGIGWRRRRSA